MNFKKMNVTLGLLTLAFSLQSFGMVVDHFHCKLELKNLKAKTAIKQVKNFSIVRVPHLMNAESPEIEWTSGGTQFTTDLIGEKDDAYLGVNFYYKHAIKMDADGNAIDARQFTCVALSSNFCDKSKFENGIGACGKTMSICQHPKDPFENGKGWRVSPIVEGVPTFAVTTLSGGSGSENTTGSLDCEHKGSSF